MLVSVEQLKKETNQSPETNVFEQLDEHVAVEKSTSDSPQESPLIKSITKGNILGDGINLEKRMQMISAKGFEPAEFAFERAIGKNDSLYSNFTELIALTKRKVSRIVIKENNKKKGYATGFMVAKNLMLTNWHVFPDAQLADESETHFFYEYNAQGHPQAPVIFRFDTTKFFNNEELDYCFIGVKPVDISGNTSLDSIGYLYLDKGLGKLGDVNVERLNIIHHPQGDYKQISIRENLFVDISDTKIFYVTDTAQGSSGSPVFNDQWQVVGLHHKSIAKMSLDGKKYLDENDQVIPIINNKIDVSRIVWLRNEGIRISVILNHLAKTFDDVETIKSLEIPPPVEDLRFSTNSALNSAPNTEVIPNNTMSNDKNISINVPVSALNNENSIEISLSSKKLTPVNTAEANLKSNSLIEKSGSMAELSEFLLEIAKAEKEKEVDFSLCQGYDPNFLGINIPLPLPKAALSNQIARLVNNEIELKYFKYSVIFNAAAKMPIISAVNVEGDATQRLDNSKRNDDWLRDHRIDIECQLTDKFYSNSKFDKGHMSRFEDANWDKTEEEAKRNGIYTCFYTNACPQVPALNRGGGLWGKLEKAVLEKGVKEEHGKLARMTVFNGPIFNDEKDKFRKGVRIPMEYYKIILWLNQEEKLCATGFKLSQETLVGQVVFDEKMKFDVEAIDIDKDIRFKDYRCSIKKLSRLTNIDFKHLEPFDTFVSDGNDEVLIENEESLTI